MKNKKTKNQNKKNIYKARDKPGKKDQQLEDPL